ncbi:hypothetical protein BH10PSE14_BH10PSE14_23390 [soil metagenome]
MIRATLILLPVLALTACAGDGTAPRTRMPAPYVPIPGGTAAGMDRVIGQPAGALIGLFGQPAADVREGNARKLQFGNATCVLDAYLYPKGTGEPLVSYIDARRTDGSPVDRASCVGALQIGRGGRR